MNRIMRVIVALLAAAVLTAAEPACYRKAEGITGMSTPFVEILECDTTGKAHPQQSKPDAGASREGSTLVVRYIENGQSRPDRGRSSG
jgi:hypothetical protein